MFINTRRPGAKVEFLDEWSGSTFNRRRMLDKQDPKILNDNHHFKCGKKLKSKKFTGLLNVLEIFR